MTILSTDVGGMPIPNGFNEERFLLGCESFERSLFQPCLNDEESLKYFEKSVCDGLLDKIGSGIIIPCYPQYRDMIAQFADFYKIHEGYFSSMPGELLTDQGYNPQYTFVAEVKALERNLRRIIERTGMEQVDIKVCLTSPLDLSFEIPTNFLVSMARNALMSSKHLKTRIITLDIPSYGYQMVVDKAIESAREFFDGVKATRIDVETALHLHSGNHRDFLKIESLDILELHSEFLDSPPVRRRELKDYDKFLQIGIAPTAYPVEIEPIGILRKRIRKAISMFGDRVKYVSPDCSLKGLSNRRLALRLLRNISEVAREVE